jgi:hypothetical protein
MEPDGSLSCSQQPTTGPYNVVDESSAHTQNYTEIIFNIILSYRAVICNRCAISWRQVCREFLLESI